MSQQANGACLTSHLNLNLCIMIKLSNLITSNVKCTSKENSKLQLFRRKYCMNCFCVSSISICLILFDVHPILVASLKLNVHFVIYMSTFIVLTCPRPSVHYITTKLHDFRLPLRSRRELCSSRLLCSKWW